MRATGNTAVFLLVLILASIHSGCRRRPLEDAIYKETEVVVHVSWKETPLTPASFTVICYPVEGGVPIMAMSNSDSVTVALPAGTYDILVFNENIYDFKSLKFRNTESFEGIEAYTSSHTDELYEYIEEPEQLAVWTVRGYVVEESLHIHPAPKLVTSTVEVDVDITNPSSVYSSGSYVGGFASGIRLYDGKPSENSAAYKVPFQKLEVSQMPRGRLYASFNGFGFRDGVSGPLENYFVDIIASLVDGSAFRERRVADDCITWKKGNWDETVITINVPDVLIPAVIGGGGWRPSIPEWNEKVIDVPL